VTEGGGEHRAGAAGEQQEAAFAAVHDGLGGDGPVEFTTAAELADILNRVPANTRSTLPSTSRSTRTTTARPVRSVGWSPALARTDVVAVAGHGRQDAWPLIYFRLAWTTG
jgi:hypothetical protein